MSDRILLGGMTFLARHGVHPHEKATEQRFEVDVELELDLQAASLADDLARTVDYGTVYRHCRAIVEGPSVDLLETLAERIATDLLGTWPIEAVTVRVRKPDVDLGGPVELVGVEITRRRA
jgi:dihydroneopterin aldolase